MMDTNSTLLKYYKDLSLGRMDALAESESPIIALNSPLWTLKQSTPYPCMQDQKHDN